MAKWVCYENADKNLQLVYKNGVNGAVHDCGELRRDTPPDMIIAWVLKRGNPSPGDIIKLQDGTVVSLLHQTTARA